MILQEFQSQIQKLSFKPEDQFLLAISGGVDSMVLWDLFHKSELNYAIAHVNFNLRGEESNRDEQLVANKAKILNIPHHIKQIDTVEYAKEQGLSIQMAARKIRYDWFEELRGIKGYASTVTAHHLDDDIETFFINLNRGTGLKGLTGINSTKELFRPILSFTKDEIITYAKENKIRFREDESNKSLKYERNWFRHEITKRWRGHNNNFPRAMKLTMERLNESYNITEEYLENAVHQLQNDLKSGYLSCDEVLNLKYPLASLFHLLSPKGFNDSQLTDLYKAIQQHSVGKQIHSTRYRLSVDREKVFVSSKNEIVEKEYLLNKTQSLTNSSFQIEVKSLNRKNYNITDNKWQEGFDLQKLKFPLKLRRWNKGDWLIPLGMNGKKKVSDLLIDHKIPLPQKRETWILLSEDELVWVIGIQIDNRFKISKNTKEVFEITVKNE